MTISKEKLRKIILKNSELIQELKLNRRDVDVFNSLKTPKNAEEITDEFDHINYSTVKGMIRRNI
jgi:hypothetical protein